MNRRSQGNAGEQQAADFLVKKGYRIIDRNFTVRGGEIDLISRLKNLLIFTEVKLRTSEAFGYGEDAVTFIKRQRITRAISKYLFRTKQEGCDYRFDIIEINGNRITHIENVEL